jgi:hypothetical protein
MKMSGKMTRVAALSAVLLAVGFTGRGMDLVEARQPPQDPAAKLTGTWVLNRELSTGFAAPGRGRGRGGAAFAKATAPRPLFAMTASASPFAQRGGFGNEASDLTPEQRAEQAAMRELQQIDSHVTITASATEVTFKNSLREQTFAINDKTATLFIASAPVKVKLKWDKQALKQEFSNTQAKLTQTWTVDGSDRLVMTAKVESLTLVTPERKAVFDRQ